MAVLSLGQLKSLVQWTLLLSNTNLLSITKDFCCPRDLSILYQNFDQLGSEMVDLGMASMMSLKEEVTKELSRAGMIKSTAISGRWMKL